jgi:hypothetical protein
MLTKEHITQLKNKGNGDLGYLVKELKDNPSILFLLENLGHLPKNFDGSFFWVI